MTERRGVSVCQFDDYDAIGRPVGLATKVRQILAAGDIGDGERGGVIKLVMPIDYRTAGTVSYAGIGDLKLGAACRQRLQHLFDRVGKAGKVGALKLSVDFSLGDQISCRLSRILQLHVG